MLRPLFPSESPLNTASFRRQKKLHPILISDKTALKISPLEYTSVIYLINCFLSIIFQNCYFYLQRDYITDKRLCQYLYQKFSEENKGGNSREKWIYFLVFHLNPSIPNLTTCTEKMNQLNGKNCKLLFCCY